MSIKDRKKTGAIVCANGIGDALLMMIAASNLKRVGFEVTIFHSKPELLSPLFESYSFLSFPEVKHWKKTLKDYHLVIVQNDHSERSWTLLRLRERDQISHLIFFFPTFCSKKKKGDFLFDSKRSAATNIAEGCKKILNLKHSSKNNDLTVPKGKTYRRFPKRIVIHPTSKSPTKNWSASKYLKLALLLRIKGYSLSFITGPEERRKWLHVKKKGFDLPEINNLTEAAEYIFESGFLIGNDSAFGHLASNLKIPTLTISGYPKQILLWRPDWTQGHIVTPPFSLPRMKIMSISLRSYIWKCLISVRGVLKKFYCLEKTIHPELI